MKTRIFFTFVLLALVWSEEEPKLDEGTCWREGDFLDLDPEWSNYRTGAGHHHHRHQQIALPELEPLLLELRHGIPSTNHQVTVKMTLPYGGVARLPCPVRQLGNKTVSSSYSM